MSRARLRKALASRSPAEAALVPLVEAHAARLEQLDEDRWPGDPEAQSRMLRNVQALYGLDAVTIGGGGTLAEAACWLAHTPELGATGARAAARARRTLDRRVTPDSVAAAANITIARDVFSRLRAVLGERAGLAVVLSAPRILARHLGRPDDVAWAAEVSVELLRTLGPGEPDVVLLLGDECATDPALESLADFFGTPLVPLGRGAPDGVVALEIEPLASGVAPPTGWLYVTAAEIDPTADPRTVRETFDEIRRRSVA